MKEATTESFNPNLIEKLANVNLRNSAELPEKAFTFRVGTSEFMIPVNESVDLEAEKQKLEKERVYLTGFLNSVRKKLSNQKFVSGAPEAVVDAERKKESDALEKIALIDEQLRGL